MERFCTSCGAQLEDDAKFCPKCGKFFSSVRCPECGFTGDVKTFLNGCPQCGYAMGNISNGNKNTKEPKRKMHSYEKKRIKTAFKSFENKTQNDKTQSATSEDTPRWVFIIAIIVLIIIVGFVFFLTFISN